MSRGLEPLPFTVHRPLSSSCSGTHHRVTLLRRLALALLVLAGLMGASAPAQAQVPTLRWSACEDGFECATARVPRDHARPDGPSFELALIRLPAQDRARRIGSLFVNPGGPGGSGVEFVRGAAKTSLAPLADRFDIVGFDPRGVGASRPAVDCETNPERRGPFALPLPRPTRASEAALLRRVRRYLSRCLAENRGFLPYLSTANVARDLDLLRRAVRDRRLSYLGYSYGTQLGATYASLFPGRARALVLDGAVDAEANLNRPLQTVQEQTQGFEVALGRFMQACAGQPEDCRFGGGDPWNAYDELLGRLDRDPVPAGESRPVSGDDVRIATTYLLYSKQLWPVLGVALAAANAGDGELIRLVVDEFYGRREDGTYEPSTDQFVAIAGVDAVREGNADTYLRAGRESYRLFEHFWFNSGYGDLAFGLWPVAARGVFRGPFENPRSAAPALVVGTTYDPATPYIWARVLTEDLGNARLLTMRGDGHTAAFGENSACVDLAVEAYVETGRLPAPRTVCRQDVPFDLPDTAESSRAETKRPSLRAVRRLLREHGRIRPR